VDAGGDLEGLVEDVEAGRLRDVLYRQVEAGRETPGDWGFDEWLTDPTAGGWYWQKSYTKNGKLVTAPISPSLVSNNQ
jgi:hypothetical protein